MRDKIPDWSDDGEYESKPLSELTEEEKLRYEEQNAKRFPPNRLHGAFVNEDGMAC